MILSIIVAVAKNGVIGRDGTMAWNLPAEMAYFKKTTSGHPVIMGRTTHEDIGRALPGRFNVVISRNPDYKAAEGCVVVNSLVEALDLPQIKAAAESFVIGGEAINKLVLPFADKLYLTKIDAKIEGDKYFRYEPKDWRMVLCKKHPADADNQYTFEICELERKKS